jgi:hypothetical protein
MKLDNGVAAHTYFTQKKLQALLPSFDLVAFEPRVDATTSAAYLVWGPTSDTVDHWVGALADSPAGLLMATTSDGAECMFVYPSSVKRAYSKEKDVLLHVLYVKRGDSYTQAQDGVTKMLLPKATRCVCLSATSDGAFCPVPLKHASLVPFILTNAIVDASSHWTTQELLSLLSSFKNVYFFNQQGTAFQDTVGRLVGRVVNTSPLSTNADTRETLFHRQAVTHHARELSPDVEYEFGELPDEIIEEQASRALSFQTRSNISL